jgi:deoxyribose-phosphate aldolase
MMPPAQEGVSYVTRAQLAKMIDHTLLRAYATQEDINELCDEARLHGFAAVAVNPAWTGYSAKRLNGSGVAVAVAVGFPLGATTAAAKVDEAREAVRNGASEIDVVANIGALKSGYPLFVERELIAVVKAASPASVKVIIETCYLTAEEKVSMCQISMRAGAAFVKTSTGFGHAGATVEDVRLMREVVGESMGVKAAGGIRSFEDAIALVAAGANRIGTSVGPAILESAANQT